MSNKILLLVAALLTLNVQAEELPPDNTEVINAELVQPVAQKSESELKLSHALLFLVNKPSLDELKAAKRAKTVADALDSVKGVSEGSLPTPFVQAWSIKQGELFSTALTGWAKQAGWHGLLWETSELESDLPQTFNGSFEEALTKIIEGLASQGIPIHAVMYEGNRVVRIMEKK